LRRNALLALGNVGDAESSEVCRALRRALADPDPIVRGHAVWAAARLGHDDLLEPLRVPGIETDPDVLRELASPPPCRSEETGCPTFS
jgi:HEAT repeat protein